ncbi:MAG: hypothetical protein II194_05120 [Bacteroidales bacterium]|nr:hypothetical protein [Bacteroidales bacterium]
MKFGLIGHPITHSLSPALFKAGYEGRYPYGLIEGADFEESYLKFLEEYDGINVTAPFKELALAKADILSPECEVVGATNLMVKTPEGIKAYNSDYLGVRMWLSEVAVGLKSVLPPWPQGEGPTTEEWEGFFSDLLPPRTAVKALIVGLGGAGKAAAAAAESLGMEVIRMNRTVRDDETRPLSDFRECFREADIIIYNIPTTIPELSELSDEDFGDGKPKFILEANYRNPSFDETLLKKMKEANPMIGYTSGKIWLLYQAVTGYEIFTGEKPDLNKMSAVL